ncbi:uncharacterized protein WM294_006841 [Sarcoramphus papa]
MKLTGIPWDGLLENTTLLFCFRLQSYCLYRAALHVLLFAGSSWDCNTDDCFSGLSWETVEPSLRNRKQQLRGIFFKWQTPAAGEVLKSMLPTKLRTNPSMILEINSSKSHKEANTEDMYALFKYRKGTLKEGRSP